MSESRAASWANALENGEFMCIETESGYRRRALDPQGKQHLLPPDSSDDTIGNAILDALKHSRFLSLEEAQVFFDYDAVNRRYSEWVDSLMRHYGYRNKRALFKNMKCCSIEFKEGVIAFKPTHHDRLEGWSGDGISETDHVSIPIDSAPAEIGAALRLAFSRCT
jgi:hypothetical protein